MWNAILIKVKSYGYFLFSFPCVKGVLCLFILIHVTQLSAQTLPYTFDEAKAHMLQHAASLKAADAQVQMAREEQRKASALWWPQLQGEGMYAHLSEEIEVRQPLSQFTNPAKA